MKNKALIIFLRIVIVLAIIGIIGFYVYDIYANGTPYSENVFKTAAVVFALIGTLVKLMPRRGRRNLQFYEAHFKDELGQAFVNKPRLRKKLLSAVRLFDEDNFRKALKYLTELYKKAESSRDGLPVMLFIALCYSEAGIPEEAVKVYQRILQADYRNVRAHSNLGCQLMRIGDFSLALEHFGAAIDYNPGHYYAYINRANCYFRKDDYENAEKDALEALEIKGNGREAASLLAILSAVKGDKEAEKKYSRIYVNNGGDGNELKEAIAHYLAAENEKREDEERVLCVR